MGEATKGFRPRDPILRMTFEDPQYAGFYVRTRRPDAGTLLDLIEFADFDPKASGVKEVTKVASKIIAPMTESIVEWNLLHSDSDEVMPITEESVLSQGLGFVMDLVTAWMNASLGVPAPLGEASNSGQPPPEGSIPMEPLFPSPRN